MVARTFLVDWEIGLAETSSPRLVRVTRQFRSKIKASKDGCIVSGKSIMGWMLLAAEKGSKVRVFAKGHDEREAMEAIRDLFENTFVPGQWSC